MLRWCVFCTAQLPTAVIEKFYNESTLSTSAPKNAWLLQKTPTDPENPFDAPSLSCPVASFATGFENASPEFLQAFVEGLNERSGPSDEVFGSFVVLDHQSLEDATCIVYHNHYMKAPGHEDDEWEEDTPTVWQWKPWRVKFVSAWQLCSSFWYDENLVLELLEKKKSTYVNDRGILTLAGFENSKYQLPEWEDRSPFGPGAE